MDGHVEHGNGGKCCVCCRQGHNKLVEHVVQRDPAIYVLVNFLAQVQQRCNQVSKDFKIFIEVEFGNKIL